MPTKILEIHEIQQILGIGRNKVYDLIRLGEISAFKIGREWKVTENAIEDYIKKQSTSNQHSS